jgi:hypothetical protein
VVRGIHAQRNYTWVPRFDVVGSTSARCPIQRGNALNAFIDNATAAQPVAVLHAPRARFTLSGVWELPFAQSSTA